MSTRQRDLEVFDNLVRNGATMYFKSPSKDVYLPDDASQDEIEDAIQQEVDRGAPASWYLGSTGHVPVNELFKEELRNAVRVVAPQIEWPEDMDWKDNLFENVGPQRLPYPEMWVEYQIHSPDPDDGAPPTWVGAFLSSTGMSDEPTPILDDGGTVFAAVFFIGTATGIACMDVGTMTHVDERGELMRIDVVDFEYSHSLAARTSGRAQAVKEPPLLKGRRETEGLVLAYLVHATIGLMNCKNVTIERHERPAKQPKKSRRKRSDRLDYHTVVLPKARGASDSSEGGTDTRGLHKVRGHFKHYTAEKPLLGKHTGTYWWSWAVRGNKEHGQVVSDYRVEQSK